MNKAKFLSLFVALVLLLGYMGTALPAYADKGQPPATPTPSQTPPDQVTVIVEETTTTVQGPGKSSKPGGVLPNRVLPGPGGAQVVLTSGLSMYQDLFGWNQQGFAKIDVTSATAKAWTTLYNNGSPVESTGGQPCWTVTSCTSSTRYYVIGGGHTGSNTAETVVYWSNNTNSYANATVSHRF